MANNQALAFHLDSPMAMKLRKRENNLMNWKWDQVIVIEDSDDEVDLFDTDGEFADDAVPKERVKERVKITGKRMLYQAFYEAEDDKWEDVIVIADVDVPNEVGERNNNVELKEEQVIDDVPNQHDVQSEEQVTVDVPNQHDVQSDDDVPTVQPLKQDKKHPTIKIITKNMMFRIV
ncbi:hypothetical protein Tco_0457971 [Tanacetum coccineum]